MNLCSKFHADHFSFRYLCPKVNGLWEIYNFRRSNIAVCGAPYTRFHKNYLFGWKGQKKSANTTLWIGVSSSNSNFVWLLKFKEFFQHFKNEWNYFQNWIKLLLDLYFVLQHFSKSFGDFQLRKWFSIWQFWHFFNFFGFFVKISGGKPCENSFGQSFVRKRSAEYFWEKTYGKLCF